MSSKTTSTNKQLIIKVFLLLILIIGCHSFYNSSQAQSYCFTPTQSKKSNFRQSFNTRIAQNSYHLKIYVHVIRNFDGSGGFTAEEVDEILNYLDLAFNPHHIFFNRDENIDFIDNDYWANGPSNYNTLYSKDAIFEVNNHFDGIDIYLFPDDAPNGGGLANGVGESSEFWVSGSNSSYGAYAKSFVIAHEMGHVLNLWHTHHSCESSNWEATDGSNCDTTGDYVCDTPSDPDMNFAVDPQTCEWDYQSYCIPPESVFSYIPDTKNIMGYSNLFCIEYFSEGQGIRMREAIATLPYLQAVATTIANNNLCNAKDWNALKKLYNSTNGNEWTNNANWAILNDTIPENCSLRGLHGITFDATGRVTGINLYNNNLTGTIPAEIENLSELKYLDLGNNFLKDTIPSQIGNLSKLEILFLDANDLTGVIPIELIKLTELAQLQLKNNLLSGCYDVILQTFCNKANGGNVSISEGNNFNASFNEFCSAGTNICPIKRCNIEDWLALKAFYNSTNGAAWNDNLNWEMIANNLPPVDCDLRRLRGISLNVEGRVMSIDLLDNNLTGSLPNEIEQLSALTNIDLGFNQLEDTIPSAIKNLKQLNALYLDNNTLTGALPKAFSELNNLKILYLNNNALSGCFDSSLVKLCIQLESTYNKNKYISDGNIFVATWEEFCQTGTEVCILPCVAEWNALKQLYLNTHGDNWVFNTNWEIVLSNNPPANCDFSSLFGITTNQNGHVTKILLSGNNLIGKIPSEISDLPYLTDLSLWSNGLTGVIPPQIGLLSNLHLLDLYFNNLTGSLPVELSTLAKLKYLYIDYNDLSGCFEPDLTVLCTQLSTVFVNGGNNFDADWADFCGLGSGACSNNAELCNSIPELNLAGVHEQEETFYSSKTIQSNAVIKANVTYKAGETVELNAGFTADGTHRLDIQAESCE